MNNIVDCAEAALEKAGIKSGDSIMAAVSGGPDSMAMLLALNEIAQTKNLDLKICHVNHMLRDGSDSEAEFTFRTAREMGIDCAVLAVDVPGHMDETGAGIEEAAREYRHKAIRLMAAALGVNTVAFGHTADDRAETILHNILRGTGIRGLHAMSIFDGVVVRPLLETTKQDVLDFLESKGQEFVVDETNVDLVFERNMIRLRLIPYIEENLKTTVRSSLCRLAKVAEDEDVFLDELADREATGIVVIEGSTATIDRHGLAGLTPALARRIIRRSIERISGDLQNIGLEHVNAILEGLSKTHGSISLPNRLEARFEYDKVVIGSRQVMKQEGFTERVLPVPGVIDIPELKISMNASKANTTGPFGKNVAYIDASKIEAPLKVRPRHLGDRFVPYGMTGMKKLQDFFVDEKVPLRRRDGIPIVESSDGIVWVAGLRVDARFAALSSCSDVIKLSLSSNHKEANQ